MVEGQGRMRKNVMCDEELYRVVFETAGTAIIVIDEDTTILLANSHFEKLSGYSKEELEGRMSWTAFIAAEDVGRMKEYHEARRKDPGSAPQQYEFVFVDRSGGKRDILLNVSLIPGTGRSVASCMDITERKEAERFLKKSEQNYRNILESIQEAYYEVDLEGNFTFFNARAWQELGYPEGRLLGMNFRQYIHPDDVDKVFEVYHKVFVTGRPEGQVTFTVITHEGKAMPVETSVSLRKDETGRVVGFKGVVRDVSVRAAYEAALRESEERYRLLAENSSDVIWTLSLEGVFTYASPSVKTLAGYEPREIIGKRMEDFLTLESSSRMRRVLTYELGRSPDVRGMSGTFEMQIMTKDGALKDIEVTTSWILDDESRPVGLQGSARDITMRKKAEEELKRSEERFRDLAELLPETVYEADLSGRITFVNKAGLEQFGYTEEDVRGGLTVEDIVHPSDKGRLRENFLQVKAGRMTGLNEYTVVRKDGTTFSGLARSSPVTRDGRVTGFRGVLVDITEKKNLEARLMHAQRMEAIGTLAGGVAHDFNNLLMGILGNVSLLLAGVEEGNPAYERLKSMEEYVRRGSELTKQLLGFARGGKYEVKTTDMAGFVQRSAEMFGRTKKDIRMHVKAVEGLHPVEVDRGQMDQVFLNLFVNAWQAMPEGGDIFISLENSVLGEDEVAPHGLRPGRYVKITVTDTGVGMPPEILSRVFEPFFTTKERGRGTGLGLASVYGIVKNHGGFILVDSEKDVGTSFTIYLPASDKTPEKEEKKDEGVEKGSGTVLLVDDEDMILSVGRGMLERLGYTVIAAQGGREGVRLFGENAGKIDLVILDMVMPEFSGRETFEAMRRQDPGVKVLLSSGYSLDGQARQLMDSGCNGFIQKPFTMAELSKKISEILKEDRTQAA